MRSAAVLLFAASCVSTPARPQPAVLSGIETSPAEQPVDRMPRLPAIALHFDHALAPPHEDSVWVLTGRVTESIVSDARRGGLSSSNQSRRLAAQLQLDPEDPA